ncbi:uncharacterized protein LOC108652660 [Drosophila navojoa]|uniref:uncharacterized protein LOC108652660 n=1 Tax=Drosophila navojoa TaxID=7232 RepID=UPI000847B436|nr:uncharacterized protein LOC108652660 [Drosophila navojoa]
MYFRIGIIFYLWHLYRVCADSPLVYKSTNIECFPDPAFAVNATCYLKAINWNKAVAHMDCDLVLPLANTSVHIELFKRDYSNRYHPFLVNAVVNVCDIISKRNFLTYGMMFWKVIKKYTNVNHSCPIKGHLLARNLYIDEKLMPNFPQGFYQISLKFFENYPIGPARFVGTVKFYVNVKEMVKIKQQQ